MVSGEQGRDQTTQCLRSCLTHQPHLGVCVNLLSSFQASQVGTVGWMVAFPRAVMIEDSWLEKFSYTCESETLINVFYLFGTVVTKCFYAGCQNC